jgi:hypothetical protein
MSVKSRRETNNITPHLVSSRKSLNFSPANLPDFKNYEDLGYRNLSRNLAYNNHTESAKRKLNSQQRE